MKSFSFFEVESGVADKVLKSMKGEILDGREINLEYAEKRKKKDRKSFRHKKKRR